MKGTLLILCVVAGLTLHEADAQGAGPKQPTLRVGSVTLERCQTPAPWCGRLSRPLDPAGEIKGSISIYFEFYPHSASGPAQGTLVAAEGGPGYSTTESRADYLALYEPLRAHRDVLLMDYRGTGRSGALDCPRLQHTQIVTEEMIGECGRALGPQAALYSSAFAADDLAAIIQALELGKVDLYGDSYGSFFSQVFAVRHPQMLRTLVLDGADALEGGNFGWYPNYAPAAREKFNLVCQRSPVCSRLPGSSIDRIRAVLQKLRSAPIEARAPDGNGRLQRFVANAAALATVMYGSAPRYASVRELDAAGRAFLQDDPAPLLRLMAESRIDTEPDASLTSYSAALAFAVACQDEPQIYDMRLPPEARVRERDRVIAEHEREAPHAYDPFTLAEYRGMPLDYGYIDECVRWPVAPPAHPAGQVLNVVHYPDLPVLVISGDLDTLTPIADADIVVRHFPNAQHLILRNSFHVNALPRARSDCGARITRAFIETLEVGDTGCREAVPPVRVAPLFARSVSQVEAAEAAAGNEADPAGLRAVSAAVLTAQDIIDRLESNTSGRGVGLRGGTFEVTIHDEVDRITLHGIRWTQDLTVSGSIERRSRDGVSADLTLTGPATSHGTLSVHWREGITAPQAEVHGELDGRRVAATLAAP